MKLLLFLCMCPMIGLAQLQVTGHRGARGTHPENTLPAFRAAIDAGVDYIEIDLVVSADQQVVISHEPWLNPEICLGPDGKRITNEQAWNLYRMPYAEIRRCDCGSLRHPRFPDQQTSPQHKPLLSEALDDAYHYYLDRADTRKPAWLIEIKYTEGDTVYYPPLEAYTRVLHKALEYPQRLQFRMVIQSFSPEILNALHVLEPEWSYGLLVHNTEGLEVNLARLNFRPDYYNPHYSLVDAALLDELRVRRMGIHVWTVNDLAEAERLRSLGVTGVITDFPDRIPRE
ncbi:MAG: glycerophosphodiester phosphodiesterase [Bacteroidetes bacterium]|nr:glycerophosphodiester phosphodiesterase [Bacteroidota bacterium]